MTSYEPRVVNHLVDRMRSECRALYADSLPEFCFCCCLGVLGYTCVLLRLVLCRVRPGVSSNTFCFTVVAPLGGRIHAHGQTIRFLQTRQARETRRQMPPPFFKSICFLTIPCIGYTLEVVQDARDYADHAGRADIGMDDVRLAVRKKQDALSAGPPTREVCTARHDMYTTQALNNSYQSCNLIRSRSICSWVLW